VPSGYYTRLGFSPNLFSIALFLGAMMSGGGERSAEKLRAFAARCRDLARSTRVSGLKDDLLALAEEMEKEAASWERRQSP
jgi:hypothetical protein